MLDAFAISIIRQAVQLYKRGYTSVVPTLRWGMVKETSFENGDIPFDEVTQAQYTQTLNSLSTEFTGTDLLTVIASL